MNSHLVRSCDFFLLSYFLLLLLSLKAQAQDLSDAESTRSLGRTVDEAPVTPGTLSHTFLSCPVMNEHQTQRASFGSQEYTYKNSTEIDYSQDHWDERLASNWSALDGLVELGMHAVLIDIRQVEGKPAYLYLASRGRQHKLYETWSSSKFIAAVAAISKARLNSEGKVGAESKVGGYQIGDLISRMHRYYVNFGAASASSNALGKYFAKLAGASTSHPEGYANWLLGSGWLKMSDATYMNAASFGESPFDPESLNWTSDVSGMSQVMPPGTGNGNKEMSALAQAEILKRMSQHERDPSTRVPGFQDIDAQILFYGNPARSGEPGGMSAGVSNYLTHGLTGASTATSIRSTLDAMAGDQWRVYSKMGWGDSSNPNRGCSAKRPCGEAILVAYACLPQYQGGHEFVLVTYASYPGRTHEFASKKTSRTVDKLMTAIKLSWQQAHDHPQPENSQFYQE